MCGQQLMSKLLHIYGIKALGAPRFYADCIEKILWAESGTENFLPDTRPKKSTKTTSTIMYQYTIRIKYFVFYSLTISKTFKFCAYTSFFLKAIGE